MATFGMCWLEVLDFLFSALVALATVVLAVVAVYGYDVRRSFRRPELRIGVDDPKGNGTYFVDAEGKRKCGCRWFHVNVSTSLREFPFHDTFVQLRQVKEERPGGELHVAWRGRIPLQWRHEPPIRLVSMPDGTIVPIERPFRPKTVGPLAQADLFHIDENEGFKLNPRDFPNDLATLMERICKPNSKMKLALVVQAVSDEAESTGLQVTIDWSGEWAEADSDFERLITVRETQVEIEP